MQPSAICLPSCHSLFRQQRRTQALMCKFAAGALPTAALLPVHNAARLQRGAGVACSRGDNGWSVLVGSVLHIQDSLHLCRRRRARTTTTATGRQRSPTPPEMNEASCFWASSYSISMPSLQGENNTYRKWPAEYTYTADAPKGHLPLTYVLSFHFVSLCFDVVAHRAETTTTASGRRSSPIRTMRRRVTCR